MDGMKIYVGTKTIMAMPMNRIGYNRYQGWQLPQDENGDDPGYLVEYLDGGQANHPNHKGYISWSPTDVFERAYRETARGMTFSHALELIKAGSQVQRRGWNGKGMWLSLATPVHDAYVIHAFGTALHPNDQKIEELPLLPWIGMRTATGEYVPWLASQTDMLAEDWEVFVPA